MEGYAQIAWRIANHDDLGIFRRFAALQAQDLLYRQAELKVLEIKLRQQESSNSQSQNERQTWYSRDWQTLSKAEAVEGIADTQWQTFLEIRENLAKYSEPFNYVYSFGRSRLTSDG
jgi:hypothetical protein